MNEPLKKKKWRIVIDVEDDGLDQFGNQTCLWSAEDFIGQINDHAFDDTSGVEVLNTTATELEG